MYFVPLLMDYQHPTRKILFSRFKKGKAIFRYYLASINMERARNFLPELLLADIWRWSGAWCLFSESSWRLDWRFFRGCYSAATTAAGRTPGRFSATARRWSRRGHVLIQPRRRHILLILFQLAAAQTQIIMTSRFSDYFFTTEINGPPFILLRK